VLELKDKNLASPQADDRSLAVEERKVNLGPATLVLQDALAAMRRLPDNSFDLAIADPPYGASTKATWRLDEGHNLPGFGGAWKLASHEWDQLIGLDGFVFTICWLTELKRLVRPTGSIWIHGTYHNAGLANVVCQMLGLEIINEVIWFKRNAFPNLACRRLTASHETLLWVHTGGERREYRFNYEAVKQATFPGDSIKQPDSQLRTVWDISNNKAREELRFGKHPTQKPLRVTERILLIAGGEGGSVLVPFMGSGTEMVAAIRAGMVPTGYETDPESFDLAVRRVSHEVSQGR
jgi:site-specific DNA-methyltransferase (adenine-specific)